MALPLRRPRCPFILSRRVCKCPLCTPRMCQVVRQLALLWLPLLPWRRQCPWCTLALRRFVSDADWRRHDLSIRDLMQPDEGVGALLYAVTCRCCLGYAPYADVGLWCGSCAANCACLGRYDCHALIAAVSTMPAPAAALSNDISTSPTVARYPASLWEGAPLLSLAVQSVIAHPASSGLLTLIFDDGTRATLSASHGCLESMTVPSLAEGKQFSAWAHPNGACMAALPHGDVLHVSPLLVSARENPLQVGSRRSHYRGAEGELVSAASQQHNMHALQAELCTLSRSQCVTSGWTPGCVYTEIGTGNCELKSPTILRIHSRCHSSVVIILFPYSR